MRIATRLFACLSVLAVLCAAVAAQPISAEKAIEEAGAKAKAEKKNILLIFSASWCGWCKKLDRFLTSEEFKPAFSHNFVTVHMTVRESEVNKPLETPGATELMTQLGGKDAGLPFYAILKPDGTPIVTSMRPYGSEGLTENIGYPATEQEIAYFITMLEKGAPHMTAEQRSKIKEALGKKAAVLKR